MVGWADQAVEGAKGNGSDVGLWRLRLGGVLVACGNVMRGWRFVQRRGWPLTPVSTQYSLSLSISPLQSLSLSLILCLSRLSLTFFFYFLFFIILSESASRVKSVNRFKKKIWVGLGGVGQGWVGGARKGWLGLKYYI